MKKAEGFIANDGNMFKTLAEAIDHEIYCEIEDFVKRKFKGYIDEYDRLPSTLAFLFQNHFDELYSLMTKLKNDKFFE